MIGVEKGDERPENLRNHKPQVPCLALRAPQAAEALGISESTLWRWVEEGIVPSVLVGGTRVFSVDALREWLLKMSQQAATPAQDTGGGR